MPENKNTRKRLQILENLLQSRKGYSVTELVKLINETLKEDGFGVVTSRTIYHDIDAIKNEGIEIEKLKGSRIRYEDPNDTIWKTTLLEDEKQLLEMSLRAFSVFKGSSLYNKYNDVITRLMSGSILRGLNKVDNTKIIQIGDGNAATGQEWIETIYDAIINKKSLKVFYKPYGRDVSERVISPYVLKEYRNEWFMLAYSDKNKPAPGTNVFKLNRIQKITTTDDEYFIDENFDASKYFKYSLGVYHQHSYEPVLVKLKVFKSLIAYFLETPIHSTMEIVSKTDGELIITFNVYNTVELESLILGYGANVEVLEPIELRDKIKLLINQISSMYEF